MRKTRRYVAWTFVAGLLEIACSSGDAPPMGAPETGAAGGANGPALGVGGSEESNDDSSADALPGAGSPGEVGAELPPLSPTPAGAPSGGAGAPPDGGMSVGAPAQARLPALLAVRQEHAVVALGGEVYVIGGFTPNVTATVEAYDPSAESWRRVADFPVALHHANAAEVGGKLYVAGFYLGSSFSDAEGRVFEYDPALDNWSERGAMPAGSERASSCVAALDGEIYLFGGARADSVPDASAYDVDANSWRELPPLPEPREHCVAGAIDGMIYIAAGRSDGIAGLEPNTWAFDPGSGTYQARAPIPTPRGGVAGAVLGSRLYVFGGEGNATDPSGVFADVEAFDPASNGWQVLPAMLAPRHGLAAAALGERIYLPGGAATQGFGAVDDHTVMSLRASEP